MARRVPEGPPPPPVVQRVRLRYAKRGRLRFISHRDFARAFERALRRAGVPMAYSAGFSPHPKISYAGAAPTGTASEAEFVEIGLARTCDIEQVRAALDEALPPGIDVVEAVPAGPGSLADRLAASRWLVHLTGVTVEDADAAFARLLDTPEVLVERVTKSGRRDVDVRAAMVSLTRLPVPAPADRGLEAIPAAVIESITAQDPGRAIMDLVVRQVTPTVRPDDVITALRQVAGLALSDPPVAVRIAQGPLDPAGKVGDPLAADRAGSENVGDTASSD